MKPNTEQTYHSRWTINIIDTSDCEDESVQNTSRHRLRPKKNTFRISSRPITEFMAEFLGTALIIIIGVGTVAQVVLSDILKTPGGEFLSIAWGFGIAVMLGVIVAGKVSGGHLNPAVSVAFTIFGKLKPWYKCIYYMTAQYMGAFFGSMIVYFVYYEAFHKAGINFETSKIFPTHPAQHISMYGVFFDELVSTGLLLLAICAITDRKNLNIPPFIQPFLIGLVVYVLVLGFSFNSGAALNPARDLGPRLFTTLFGWSLAPFTHSPYFWIVVVISTHLGGILGVMFYQLLIGLHLQSQDENITCSRMNV